MERLGAIVRTDENNDHAVIASTVAAVIFAAQVCGGMTPREIGEAAALALVDQGGFHRRQFC